MAAEAPGRESSVPPSKRPPCRRCGANNWHVEVRDKTRPRWLLETLFAVPDVLIFQGESGGWPGRQYEQWTCQECGRRVRVPH